MHGETCTFLLERGGWAGGGGGGEGRDGRGRCALHCRAQVAKVTTLTSAEPKAKKKKTQFKIVPKATDLVLNDVVLPAIRDAVKKGGATVGNPISTALLDMTSAGTLWELTPAQARELATGLRSAQDELNITQNIITLQLGLVYKL
jgi:hypothetical protein